MGLTPYPRRPVSPDDGKLTETRCQSGLFTLIGRESANKEVHLPETMILEIPPRRLVRAGEAGDKRVVSGRGQDGHLLGKVSSEVAGGEGRGRVALNWGLSRPGRLGGSRAGREMRGEGGGGEGRGGREEEGVRGRNLPPLAASLSAPGLGTKGGTLMNSLLPSPPDARVSPSRNFAAATFSAVRPHKSVGAPRRLQQGKCPLKMRRGGEEVSGNCCLVYLSPPGRSRLPALRRTEA